MAIDRTVRAEIVAGITGPVSAPSASFEDFADPGGISVGDPVTLTGAALSLATNASAQVLGVVREVLLNGNLRVQTVGVAEGALTSGSFAAGDLVYMSGAGALVGSLTVLTLDTVGATGPLVGVALNANDLLLTTNGVPPKYLDVLKKFQNTFVRGLEDVYTVFTNPSFILLDQNDEAAGAAGPALILASRDTSLASGDVVSHIQFKAEGTEAANDLTNIEAWGVAAIIEVSADGTWADDDHPGRIELQTTTAGDVAPSTKVTVDNAGNVGIGNPDPQVLLHVSDGSSGVSPAGLRALLESDGATLIGVGSASSQAGIGLYINGSGSGSLVYYDTGTLNVLTNTNGVITLGDGTSNGGVSFDIGGEVAAFKSDLDPDVTNTRALGSAVLAWNEAWINTVGVTTVNAVTVNATNLSQVKNLGAEHGATNIVTMTSDYAVSATDRIVVLQAGDADNRVLTLPTGVANDGRMLNIINHADYIVDITTSGSDLFGYTVTTTYSLAHNLQCELIAFWNGSNLQWITDIKSLDLPI